MAETPYSGTQYDARTGEPLPADFRVPRYAPSTVLDMRAVDQNIKSMGVEAALKATEAAIQFQGQRGYQQALKNGESAEKALVKYGPMMFYKSPQAFGPSVKALTPPSMTPYQSARLGLDRERLNKPKAVVPPKMFKSGPDIVTLDPMTGAERSRIKAPIPAPVITETIRQERNPDFYPGVGTNIPPYFSFTNRATRGVQPQASTNTTSKPATSVKRVKVKGPGGVKGTVVEGTQLPEGWSLE